MSKYSEKHHQAPKCSVEWCDSTGTCIRSNGGNADWFCTKHDPEKEA